MLSEAPKDLSSEFNELFLGVGVDITVVKEHDESVVDQVVEDTIDPRLKERGAIAHSERHS
jgi:hypothetical protein